MALVAFQSVSASRDELLWKEELARVRADRHLLTPAAAAAVQSVLSSVLHQPDQNKEDLLSVLALIQEASNETATPPMPRRTKRPFGKSRPAWP